MLPRLQDDFLCPATKRLTGLQVELEQRLVIVVPRLTLVPHALAAPMTDGFIQEIR